MLFTEKFIQIVTKSLDGANDDFPGAEREEWTNLWGVHHRVDGPAIRVINPVTGQTLHENWIQRNRSHRVGGPAYVTQSPELGRREEWLEHGVLHRLDGPAIIERAPNGVTTLEVWAQSGKNHRLNGPAITVTDPVTGVPYRKEWYAYGLRHREHGRAIHISDRETGAPERSEFWIRGKLHNDFGPAVVNHNPFLAEMLPKRRARTLMPIVPD